MKTCSRCHCEKEESEFFRQSSAKDGRQSHCKVCDNERSKAHRKVNPEAHREKKRRYRARHEYARRRHAAGLKKWKAKNRDAVNRYMRAYRAKRVARDPAFKLRLRLSSGLGHALRGHRKAVSVVKLLGVSIEQARVVIERQFTPGMTWANWGEVWHVDHIRPLSGFDLTDPVQLREACHITNLRPLAKAANLAKGGKREFLL